ncbi:MAG: MarR family transcriptional regulator [Mesorhizobium sp.]|nr:MarR family transcriptional regulator [Mesorhizobium sp.]
MSTYFIDEAGDRVGRRRRQWASELPDVDTSGMAVLGRARWITLAVRPSIEAVFARHGLDSGEFDTLATLLRSGPPYRLRPTELFSSMMISSGGLTDRLGRLQRARLISRPADSRDARSLPVQLTDEGKRIAEAAFREDMTIEAGLLDGLTEDDRRQLGELLGRLAMSVEGKIAASAAPGDNQTTGGNTSDGQA